MNKEDVGRVYDTLLSSPGMNELVKVDLKIDRKTILLMSQVVLRGLSAKPDEEGFGLKDVVPKESAESLKTFIGETLGKAGLTELSQKLNALAIK